MDKYILLCITADTIIGLYIGTFDEVSKRRDEYKSVVEATGNRLKIESVREEISDVILNDTSKVMEEYGYLVDRKE